MKRDDLAKFGAPRAGAPIQWSSTTYLESQARDLCNQVSGLRAELGRIGTALWLLLILATYGTVGVLALIVHLILN